MLEYLTIAGHSSKSVSSNVYVFMSLTGKKDLLYIVIEVLNESRFKPIFIVHLEVYIVLSIIHWVHHNNIINWMEKTSAVIWKSLLGDQGGHEHMGHLN